ncbi:hypothetical protein Smp_027740 [Schistosoma mansoni]|uniref:hypothetical protein n=1 Tax=Schistosoma mansoni TaxID=6183 RepID=UPI00022C8497|nr:hypothetical protein Smp_027740 [Schistosoma mansoni]|eukprot:XP_018646910.1 hypothetical protein Smp_027740 [Schistosoma mansoni]
MKYVVVFSFNDDIRSANMFISETFRKIEEKKLVHTLKMLNIKIGFLFILLSSGSKPIISMNKLASCFTELIEYLFSLKETGVYIQSKNKV